MPHTGLARLADDFFELRCDIDPLGASLLGVERAADRLPDLSPQAQAGFAAQLRSLEAGTRAVADQELAETELVTREVLLHELSAAATALEDGLVEISAGGSLSPFALLVSVLPKTEGGSSPADYAARLRAVPGLLGQAAERWTDAATRGRTNSRRALQQTIGQVDALVGGSGEPFSAPFPADATVVALAQGAVVAALGHFRDRLTALLPTARDEDHSGLVHLPGGSELYAHAVREHTTTQRSPEELHRTGLDLCAALREEYAELGEKVFGTGKFDAVVERLREDPGLRYAAAEEIEADAKAALARAQQAVPSWFGRVPAAACEVLPMSDVEGPTGVLGYYQPSSGSGRPGRHWINTYAPQTRTRYEYETLAFHESVPGHHLQFSLAQELGSLPLFRRYGYVTAFGEGWALYTERLSDEMGLYSSDLARFGMLSFDSWRACRLVVDTGIHAFGWTWAQAVEFMLANSALTLDNITNEVDRYITWPGQALAYMTGRLEIDRLRRLAEVQQGARFDIRAFHDVVLGGGSLPLTVLDDVVTRWTTA